jgi:7-carboxy-7-deazaguanine synthase
VSKAYPLAPNGVFRSIQGEGALLGVPMVFVRLAGCSVGCPLCDTDYRVAEKRTAGSIADRVDVVAEDAEWVWITGGEPTDHDLTPLVAALRPTGRKLALATSGARAVQIGGVTGGFDFLGVSPHDPARWAQRRGDQVNLVLGLNGHGIDSFWPLRAEFERGFPHRYVTPCAGDAESLGQCLEWVARCSGWRLGVQAQKVWGVA